MTRLFVSVAMRPRDDLRALTRQIVAAAGHEPDGSGCGFGYRDVDFTVPDEAEAKAAARRVRAALDGRSVFWSTMDEKEEP